MRNCLKAPRIKCKLRPTVTRILSVCYLGWFKLNSASIHLASKPDVTKYRSTGWTKLFGIAAETDNSNYHDLKFNQFRSPSLRYEMTLLVTCTVYICWQNISDKSSFYILFCDLMLQGNNIMIRSRGSCFLLGCGLECHVKISFYRISNAKV